MSAARTAVFSFGNVLMHDDAYGPTVVATLRARYDLPDDVEVTDLGTPGFDLHPHLTGHDHLILVDTVRAKDGPGGVRTYDAAAIQKHPPQPRTNPHDPGLKEALMAMEFEGSSPESILLVATVPETTEMEPGLTPAVQAAVDPSVERVVEALRALGHTVEPKAEPLEPDLWWLPGAGNR
ncbi:MAG TPA: hydrogenase maturation protease [Candidatus Krumholzibacteria bacterium]|nr:hydrogenase maturation protease [Candidatus Krumholzibacteria bacterium]